MKQQTKSKIRKDDTVIVIAGNSRGQSGKVLRINGERVYVQGVNQGKKHVKATRTSKGSIIEIERPIHVSNLKVCNAEGKPVKLRVKVSKDGHRELCYKEGSKSVTYRPLSRAKTEDKDPAKKSGRKKTN